MVEPKNKRNLGIHPTPFRSSYLAIPPSPFSPRTPLDRSFIAPPRRTKSLPSPDTTSLPPSPLQWLWQCHQCRRTYALGVTRRCLEDGHHFCAGTTTVKMWRKPLRPGKVRRHKACASEFDYQGWKNWGRWRRSPRKDSIYDDSSSCSSFESPSSEEDDVDSRVNHETIKSRSSEEKSAKDCWNACDYPSECRWGKRFGVHTPVTAEVPSTSISPTSPLSPLTTFEGILKVENCKEAKKEQKGDNMDFWGALIATTTRRKSVPPSSPLASVVEEPEAVETKDRDGDTIMETIDPALISRQAYVTPAPPSVTATLAASTPVATLREIIRKGSKRVAKSSKAVESEGEKSIDAKRTGPARSITLGDFDFGLEDAEDLAAELTPLERVKSRDSGYHSFPEYA